MDKQQMQKILIPAAAVAGVILLVGLIVFMGNSSDPTPTPNKDGKGGVTPAGPSASGKFDVFPLDGPEWKALPGGVKYWDVKEGAGEAVKEDGRVQMHYTLWLASNGTRVQSSKDGGKPFPATLSRGSLIDGWIEGVPGMKPGGTRRLFIPAAKGYGSQNKGDIPPNSDLVFEVEVLPVQ